MEVNVVPLIDTVMSAIWLMLPAYIANGAAAFFGSIFGRTPIDLNRVIGGNRVLGDGKTYEGFLSGVVAGFSVGILQERLAEHVGMATFTIGVLLCLTAGALFGDLAASFVKRRLNIGRGAPLPVIDQLDFVAGAFLFMFIFARDWFIAHFTPHVVIAVLFVTPLLHILTNFIAFILRIKSEPW